VGLVIWIPGVTMMVRPVAANSPIARRLFGSSHESALGPARTSTESWTGPSLGHAKTLLREISLWRHYSRDLQRAAGLYSVMFHPYGSFLNASASACPKMRVSLVCRKRGCTEGVE
jgi:hypothetical protein